MQGEVVLTIRVPGPGQPPEVTGPIKDKMLCYALLEAARDAIKDFNDRPPSLIEVPRLNVPPPNQNHR